LRGAPSAWRNRLVWSRSCVSDYTARHSPDDRAHRAPDERARDCAAHDSSDGSIAVGQGKLRRHDEGHGCDEKERFLIHEFLLLRLRQYVVGNCDIAARELLLLGAIPLRLSGTGSESTQCLEAEGTVMHLSNESLIVIVGMVAGWLAGTS
jgi:hypothetical protein